MRDVVGELVARVDALGRDVVQRLGQELVVAAVGAVDQSSLVRASTEPTAPPSWPMLECAGPWIRPSPASSSTCSSKARISTSWLSIVAAGRGRRRPSPRRSRRARPRATAGSSAVWVRSWVSSPVDVRGPSQPETRLDPITPDRARLDREMAAGSRAMIGSNFERAMHGTTGPARHAPARPHRFHGARPRRGARRSWSTCSAASTCTRSGPFARRRRLDEPAPQRHPRAVMRQLHFFRCGGAGDLRGLRVRRADQRATPPRNSDVGGHHVALYVEDLDAAVDLPARDRASPCWASRRPARARARASAGSTSSRPWGMQFELVSYPGGKAFDRQHREDPAVLDDRAEPDRATRVDARRCRQRSASPTTCASRSSAARSARRVDPAGGGRRAVRRQPAAGARGPADARGRGSHRARTPTRARGCRA